MHIQQQVTFVLLRDESSGSPVEFPVRQDQLPAGRNANNEAVQLLSGQSMATLVRQLTQSFDHVIIDTPPVLDLADAGILGAISDEVLLVARLRYTPQPLIEQAMRILASYNAPVAGIVGTDQKPKGNGYYQYGERGRYRRRHAA